MRHVVLLGLLAGLFTVAACSTPDAPAFDTGVLRDAAHDVNLRDAVTTDGPMTDAPSSPDANAIDAGTDAAMVGDAGCSTSCDDGDACTLDGCAAGSCTHTPVGIDDGDLCTMDTCNSTSGAIAHAPLTSIDDGDACTTDACVATSGAVSHAPVAGCCNSGTTCSSGVCQAHVCVSAQCNDGVQNGTESDMDCGGTCGPCAIGLMCNGNTDCGSSACSAGHCVACNTAADCGTSTECRVRSCAAHACGVVNTAAGSATTSQMPGDCRENQCDGAGNTVSAIQNGDTHDDGNQCTGDVCTSGVPSNPPTGTGAACSQGGGSMCNGAGVCVQCTMPTDCPGTDGECQVRTCASNLCGISFASAGTMTAAQTPNDCHRNQCNGAGAIMTAIDDTDLPADDGAQCTLETCVGGVAMHPAAGAGSACSQSGGSRCDGAGSCVTCVLAADCGTNTTCRTFACITGVCSHVDTGAGTASGAQTTGDCHHRECNGAGSEVNAVDDADLPVDGVQCTRDVCTSGVLSNPPEAVGTACTQSGGTQCNASGMCVGAPAGPTVVSTTPADASSALASTTIAVTFSTAMSPATLTGQTTAGACTGSVQVSLDDFASCVAFSAAAAVMSAGNTVATVTAAPGLLVNRTYKIRVTTAATNAGGTALGTQYTSAGGFITGSPDLCAGSVVIAQVYGAGGNAGAAYTNDYILLHNRGATSVSLAGWSLQYTSATGTFTTATATALTPLSGSIAAGGYYLVQEAAGAGAGAPLPTPDATGSLNMSASAGKVLLANIATPVGGTCPTGATVVDFVGFGTTANCSEGSGPTPAPSAANAVLRAVSACGDVNDNATDFTATPPAPLNSASAPFACGCAVENESGAGLEADYCTVQAPTSLTLPAATPSGMVFGRLYENGVTTAGAAAQPAVRAQLGYGPASANPEYQAGWVWTNATYNAGYVDASNDEYQASFTAPVSGVYRYVYRFSLDRGVTWTVCDGNVATDFGAGSNTGPELLFEYATESLLTVP